MKKPDGNMHETVLDLLRETPNMNLYRYMVVTAARAPDARLRTALEPMMRLPGSNATVAVVIPCLDEQDSIGGVVREVLAQGVDEIIVVETPGGGGWGAP